MKNSNAGEKLVIRRSLLIMCVAALVALFLAALPRASYADQLNVPPVPGNIQVPAGNVAFLVGHAEGTQNYVCLPSANNPAGVAFVLFTPQATLFSDNRRQISTHYFSPNPDEGGIVRATWQDSRDTSAVWGRVMMMSHMSADPAFVAPGAIPWLLVTVVGAHEEQTGSDTLAATTFIHRLNTTGGVAPSTGCSSSADVGHQAFVPYTADYYFYRAARGQ